MVATYSSSRGTGARLIVSVLTRKGGGAGCCDSALRHPAPRETPKASSSAITNKRTGLSKFSILKGCWRPQNVSRFFCPGPHQPIRKCRHKSGLKVAPALLPLCIARAHPQSAAHQESAVSPRRFVTLSASCIFLKRSRCSRHLPRRSLHQGRRKCTMREPNGPDSKIRSADDHSRKGSRDEKADTRSRASAKELRRE